MSRNVVTLEPLSVAIIARKPASNDFCLNKKKQKKSFKDDNSSRDLFEGTGLSEFRRLWEADTNVKIKRKRIFNKVNEYRKEKQLTLEKRRERLKELLYVEDEKLISEMVNTKDISDKRSEYIERSRQLVNKRYEEGHKFAVEKLKEQFMKNCMEFRDINQKKNAIDTRLANEYQLEVKSKMKDDELKINKIYDQLWEADYQAKLSRENIEKEKQIERNHQQYKTINDQLENIAKRKEVEQILKLDERQGYSTAMNNRLIEKENALKLKRQICKKTRNDLDFTIRINNKIRQENLELDRLCDLKIKTDLENEEQLDKKRIMEEKQRAISESKIYRRYLNDRMENIRSAEMQDRAIEEESYRKYDCELKRRPIKPKILSYKLPIIVKNQIPKSYPATDTRYTDYKCKPVDLKPQILYNQKQAELNKKEIQRQEECYENTANEYYEKIKFHMN